MNSEAATFIGLALLVLAISFGCSHCDKTAAEIEIMHIRAKQELSK